MIVERWEIDLVTRVSHRFRTPERDELAAELARVLLVLKNSGVEPLNWRDFLARCLLNRASSWCKRRSRQHHLIDQPPDASHEEDSITRMAVHAFVESLSAQDQRLIEALLLHHRQSAAARRTGQHRNTVRKRLKGIRHLARRHGLDNVTG